MQGGHFRGANGTYEGHVTHLDETVVLSGAIETDASGLGRAQILEGTGPRPTTEPNPDKVVKGGLCPIYRSYRQICSC